MEQKNILALMNKFATSDIAYFKYTEGEACLELKKETAFRQKTVVHPLVQEQNIIPSNIQASNQPRVSIDTQRSSQSVLAEDTPIKENDVAVQKKDDAVVEIKSPLVGTFYRSPSPDAPVFVEKGSKVKKGDALCILEAMKMMNTLESEFDGVIEEILAQNGDLVEFDQVVFLLRKTDK